MIALLTYHLVLVFVFVFEAAAASDLEYHHRAYHSCTLYAPVGNKVLR